jgi:hypothetical protein
MIRSLLCWWLKLMKNRRRPILKTRAMITALPLIYPRRLARNGMSEETGGHA